MLHSAWIPVRKEVNFCYHTICWYNIKSQLFSILELTLGNFRIPYIAITSCMSAQTTSQVRMRRSAGYIAACRCHWSKGGGRRRTEAGAWHKLLPRSPAQYSETTCGLVLLLVLHNEIWLVFVRVALGNNLLVIFWKLLQVYTPFIFN